CSVFDRRKPLRFRPALTPFSDLVVAFGAREELAKDLMTHYEGVLSDLAQADAGEIPKAEPSETANSSQSNGEVEELLARLGTMIGLTEVKSEVATLVNLLKVQALRRRAGLPSANTTMHAVFVGPPGTGKTTVARLFARILKGIGAIESGHLVEVSRAELVGEYIGQTAPRVDAVVDSAIGGVLFIDEAYSLTGAGSNDYGAEAVATLIKRMEDDRERLVVILAGYIDETELFLRSNPGLESRIATRITFSDYGPGELMEILELQAKEAGYVFAVDGAARAADGLAQVWRSRDKSFGNGRFVRNLLEDMMSAHANRVAAVPNPDATVLSTFELGDVEAGLSANPERSTR
ncbi:MAG: AAA family ATPase, partial [Actinomycetota bacterium]